MGAVYVKVVLRGKRGRASLRAFVDMGADFTTVPAALAKKLGLDPWGAVRCELADGSTTRLPIASALVRIDGREAPATVLVAPKGEALIGVEVLETLRLSVDPRRRRLKTTGRFGAVKLAANRICQRRRARSGARPDRDGGG
jgi:clan AA aspartic protease